MEFVYDLINNNIIINVLLALSRCSQYTEMLRDNKLTPYEFVSQKRLFLFNLHYAKVDKYLNQLAQLQRAATLHAIEQNDMV